MNDANSNTYSKKLKNVTMLFEIHSSLLLCKAGFLLNINWHLMNSDYVALLGQSWDSFLFFISDTFPPILTQMRKVSIIVDHMASGSSGTIKISN